MTIEAQEREKYRKMWAIPRYRLSSPGLVAVDAFMTACQPSPQETVVDLGCGTGRAGLSLWKRGLDVTLVDCCPEANETALPFHEAILWDLPGSLGPFDWIYCVDVLEHLPTEYVERTLAQFAHITTKGGYLQIALTQDWCGKMIRDVLHLTIRPVSWWHERIDRYWTVKDAKADGTYYRVVIGEPKGVHRAL